MLIGPNCSINLSCIIIKRAGRVPDIFWGNGFDDVTKKGIISNFTKLITHHSIRKQEEQGINSTRTEEPPTYPDGWHPKIYFILLYFLYFVPYLSRTY